MEERGQSLERRNALHGEISKTIKPTKISAAFLLPPDISKPKQCQWEKTFAGIRSLFGINSKQLLDFKKHGHKLQIGTCLLFTP